MSSLFPSDEHQPSDYLFRGLIRVFILGLYTYWFGWIRGPLLFLIFYALIYGTTQWWKGKFNV